MKTNNQSQSIRKAAVAAMLSALACALFFLEFPIPAIIPPFIKLDFSDMPALIASFTIGPWWGALVELIKNLIHIIIRNDTMGVGELSNFILGVIFVVPAGYIYKKVGGYKGAVIGSLCGSAIMAAVSVATNYFIVYPIYAEIFMPMNVIVGMYSSIYSGADSLLKALLIFNLPFTFVKGILSAVITCFVFGRIEKAIKPAGIEQN